MHTTFASSLHVPVYVAAGEHIGFLVHDPNDNKFDTHCNNSEHGGRCHVHRTLAKAPIGYLVAWLIAGHELEHASSREAHMVSRYHRGELGSVRFVQGP